MKKHTTSLQSNPTVSKRKAAPLNILLPNSCCKERRQKIIRARTKNNSNKSSVSQAKQKPKQKTWKTQEQKYLKKQKQYLYKTLSAKNISLVKLKFFLSLNPEEEKPVSPHQHTRAQRSQKEPQIKTPAHKNRKESTTIAQS